MTGQDKGVEPMKQLHGWIERIVEKLREKRAETLLELVAALALFSMMTLMMASMFCMADRVSLKNIRTDQAFDKNITDIVTEQNLETDKTVTQQVIFQKDDGSTASVNVERIKAGGFYKFRRKN